MKGPKPSFFEVLLGRTVEVELPGKPGRRRVSKKWFDGMVADGRITVSPRGDKAQLESNAQLLVRAARLGPLGLFEPLLDRFPNLAKVKPQDWDFFLSVGAIYGGLAQYEARNLSRELNKIVRGVVAEELSKWHSDALGALEDCEGFVVRSMEELERGGDHWRDALARCLGVWICWNVLRSKPVDNSDLELALVLGGLASRIVEGCWDSGEQDV